MRRHTLGIALAAGSAALVLAGCGSNTTALSTTTPTPSAESTPALLTPPETAPDPRWPQVNNAGDGALSDAQAQDVGAALMRTQVLAGWADENHQVALLPHMMSAVFLLGPSGVAMAEGDSVHTPDCGVYPTEISVHAPDAKLAQALAARNMVTRADDIPVTLAFNGPCPLTATTPSGETRSLDTLPASRLVVLVHVVDDRLAGHIAYLDAAAGCGDALVAGDC